MTTTKQHIHWAGLVGPKGNPDFRKRTAGEGDFSRNRHQLRAVIRTTASNDQRYGLKGENNETHTRKEPRSFHVPLSVNEINDPSKGSEPGQEGWPPGSPVFRFRRL